MATNPPSAEPPSLDAMLNTLVYILEAHKAHVKSRRDWALLFAHSYLLAGDFAFCGLQQSVTAGGGRSPILPNECWSDGGSEDIVLVYSRRGGQQQQQQEQQQYSLCLVTMGSELIVSVTHADTALSCALPAGLVAPVDASAEGQSGIDSIRLAYPEVERLHALLWEQLFRRLSCHLQQPARQQRPIPMPHHPQQSPGGPPIPHPLQPVPSPFDYGRADLDPFGGGGGMRFDPLRQARGGASPFLDPHGRPLPPGAVPPGARFDPFGPPGAFNPPDAGGGFGGAGGVDPDPDHMRPPGWEGGGGGFRPGRGGGGFGFGGGGGGFGSGGFGGGGGHFYM